MSDRKISQMSLDTAFTSNMSVPVYDSSEPDPVNRNKRIPKSAFQNITFDNCIIVKSEADFGPSIDSSKIYLLDGIITLTSTLIVPAGGINIRGYNFNVSGLVSSQNNYTMFESAPGGSGNIILQDLYISVTGNNSKVYDLFDATGFNGIEKNFVNYIDCSSLGEIYGYRQGFEIGTGRFGGSPFLTLSGTWIGYFISNSIVGNLSTLTAGSLFTEGTSLVFGSRFYMEMNINLPAAAVSVCNFVSANFNDVSNFQVQNCNFTRSGLFNPDDNNIIPNILPSDVKSKFNNNNGIKNTHEGIRVSTSAEAATTIAVLGTYYDITGTTTSIFADHWTKGTGYLATNNTVSPIEYILNVNLIVAGTAGDNVGLQVLVNGIAVFQINRVVSNLFTGDDIALINFSVPVTVKKDIQIKLQIANLTNTNSLTVKNSSYMFILKR